MTSFLQFDCVQCRDPLPLTLLQCAVALWGYALVLLTVLQFIPTQLRGSRVAEDKAWLDLARIRRRAVAMSHVVFAGALLVALYMLTGAWQFLAAGACGFLTAAVLLLLLTSDVARRYIASPNDSVSRKR